MGVVIGVVVGYVFGARAGKEGWAQLGRALSDLRSAGTPDRRVRRLRPFPPRSLRRRGSPVALPSAG